MWAKIKLMTSPQRLARVKSEKVVSFSKSVEKNSFYVNFDILQQRTRTLSSFISCYIKWTIIFPDNVPSIAPLAIHKDSCLTRDLANYKIEDFNVVRRLMLIVKTEKRVCALKPFAAAVRVKII